MRLLKKYGFLATVLITYCAMAALAAIYHTDYFLVAEVDIKGAKTVSKKELLRRIGIRPGYSSIFFSAGDAERELLKSPWIEEVEITREFPQRVVIEVSEAQPFCLYLDHDDELFYIGEDGTKLGRPNDAYGLDFPILISQGIGDRRLIRSAIHILKLSLKSNVLKWDEISEIDVDPIYGLSVFTRDKRRIDFGKDNVASKWYRVEKIISHSRSLNLTEKYINIDSGTTGVVNFNF